MQDGIDPLPNLFNAEKGLNELFCVSLVGKVLDGDYQFKASTGSISDQESSAYNSGEIDPAAQLRCMTIVVG